MRRIVVIVAAVAVGIPVAYAQSTAISQRQRAMKAMGAAMKAPALMGKGVTQFDLAKV